MLDEFRRGMNPESAVPSHPPAQPGAVAVREVSKGANDHEFYSYRLYDSNHHSISSLIMEAK